MKNLRPHPLVLAVSSAVLLFLIPGQARAANASPPTKMTYQGFLTDNNGVPLGNTTPIQTNIFFRIYNDATATAGLKWAEMQVVTVDKGHFTVLLGEGSPDSANPALSPANVTLESVFRGSDASERYMEIWLSGTTTATTQIAPRLQFQPAPYAHLTSNARQIVDSAGNVVMTATAGAVNFTGTVTATAFTGVNAASITTGTLPDAQLSANVAKLNANNSFTGGNTFASAGTQTIQSTAAATKPLIVKGAPGQSANLQEWQDSSGGLKATVSSGGTFTVGPINASGTITASSFSGSGAGLSGIPNAATTARSANSANTIVMRDGSGNFVANGIYSDGGIFVRGAARLGIGTSAPNFPLDVSTTVAFNNFIENARGNEAGWENTPNGTVRQNVPTSIRAPLGHIAALQFNVESDARIKQITGRTEAQTALQTLRQLSVTDFRYLDSTTLGREINRGFIAQEVEKIMPEAVSRSRCAIPDVYAPALLTRFDASTRQLTIRLKKAHGLAEGEMVHLKLPDTQADYKVTAVPSTTEFVVTADSQADKVFVYGRVVEDFRTVDYDRIFTTGIGAIQELAIQNEKLARQNQELQEQVTRLEALQSQFAQLRQLVQQLTENRGDLHQVSLPLSGKAAADLSQRR